MELHNFETFSLKTHPWGARITRVLAAAIEAVEPESAVKRFVQLKDNQLIIADHLYDLNTYRHVFIIGAGKACIPMSEAAVNILGEKVTSGVIIGKEDNDKDKKQQNAFTSVRLATTLSYIKAGHPIPDKHGVDATIQIIDLLKKADIHDLVICLISGGGSALLTSPAPGISLDDIRKLTSILLACGASINEINTLRKHLDLIKGGGLVRFAAPASVVTLILSDVVGDPLDVIASGPTVPDQSTFTEAYTVLTQYKILNQIPQSIIEHLQRGINGLLPETPKPGDALFERVQNVIIGSNRLAVQGAFAEAIREGFNTLILTTYLQGEARYVGRVLAALARQIVTDGQPIQTPACLIAGGETTVTIRGDGLGGRNQEISLGAVKDMAGLNSTVLVTMATDGEDGPTDAAGAVVTGDTYARAYQLGLNVNDYISRNDAYHFFQPLGDLLIFGSTQTNVNDLAFVFAI